MKICICSLYITIAFQSVSDRLGQFCIDCFFLSFTLLISAAQNCSDPPEIENASMLQTNISTYGDVEVTYHCDEGYMLASGQSNVSITCRDGNWAEAEDVCLRKLIEG